MGTMYLKSIFEDGTVYFRINSKEADDAYIYEGLELIQEEENGWEIDEYELTEDDLQEMYEDGFCDIEESEFILALDEAQKSVP